MNPYEVRYRVSDTYTPVAYEKIVVVPPSTVAFSIGPSGVAVGKHWQPGGAALQVAGDAHIDGNIHLADPNVIIIDGTAYQRSGTLASIPQTPAFTTYGSTFARTITVVLPFTPPAGWMFYWFTRASTGYTTIERGGIETQVRIIQVGSNDVNALKTISWQLVKA